ncbi:MAG TPA: hypothetical protein GX505_12740 [Clostridiales bacterium]|nr:hypothetical protein [Clostridiales bacterium]
MDNAAILDIREFGAVPDGIADNSEALIKAMEAAAPGDTIYFPSGTYGFLNNEEHSGVPLKSGLKYIGEEGSILKSLDKSGFIFSIKSAANITLENLTFDTMGVVISDGSKDVTLKNCTVQNCGQGQVPYCYGIYLNNAEYCYFHNNYFTHNAHCFFGESVSNSEWIYNYFYENEEALHLIGISKNNHIAHNKLRYVGRIGIEIQDDATGILMEENDIRYMTGGCYGISFAAPYSRHGLIRSNVLVGGTTFRWGAGIEVMGRVVVEQNIVYDWQEGIQFNTGYQEYLYGPVLDGATVQNNLLRNQAAIGIMKVECGDTKNLVIRNNFIENSQLNGIHFFWDQTYGALIEGNTIVRDAGCWPDDSIPFELRDIENYGDEDWFVLPVKRADQNGYRYFNTSHFAGIRMRHNSQPANILKDNCIIQRNTSVPDGFYWEGIVFDYKDNFKGTKVLNNQVISMMPGNGTGISWLYENSLDGVEFKGNLFAGLDTVIKSGQAGPFIAEGNTCKQCTDIGHEGFALSNKECFMISVEAGPNQVISLSSKANLSGKVKPDNGNVSVQWEKFAGPGEVEFSNPNSTSTQASFTRPGCYVLSLNASDGVNMIRDVVVVQAVLNLEEAEPLPDAIVMNPPAPLPFPIGGPAASYKPAEGFLPLLLKVDISSDLLDPGDDLWVTAWWQNIGTRPADCRLFGFMEMEFGSQRILENLNKSHRVIWEPHPGLHQWEPGEVWATTSRWHIPKSDFWGGTYKLYVGFCDHEHVPVRIWGSGGSNSRRAYVGEVDVAWGWGSPSLKKLRKPLITEFNTPVKVLAGVLIQPDKDTKSIVIGNDITGNDIMGNEITGNTISVALDMNRPAIRSIKGQNAEFSFLMNKKIEICFRERKTDTIFYSFSPEVKLNLSVEHRDAATVVYTITSLYKESCMAVCDLIFRVQNRRLSVSLENIKEYGNYELLEVKLPYLISLTGEDARMADFFADGRLIAPCDTRPLGYEHAYDVRNAGVLYNSRGMLVIESEGLDNKLIAAVCDNNEQRFASMGITLTARVRGKNHVRSIQVLNQPEVTIDFLGTEWGEPSWQSAARYLRQGLKGKNRELYRRSMVYKYIISWGPEPDNVIIDDSTPYPIKRLAHVNTFEKALETIKRVSRLLDGARQIVYLVGFQYSGHDTGYPYVLEINPKAGSIEDLKRCIQEAARYNAVLSLHDNYDDAYYSDYLPREILALNEEGKPCKIWFWSSDMSYAVGPKKYADLGLMQKRVKQTIETYGIHTTYHLDVLSSEVRRHDFDLFCQTAADENLQGKLAVIKEFNKYGIDITSENVAHPFAGEIGYAWWTRHNPGAVLFPGEEIIPLTPMIYHGFIQYNCAGYGKKDMLAGMIRGASTTWTETEQDIGTEHIRAFYLQTLPMGLLYDLKMEDYRAEGFKVLVEFENDSRICADLQNLTYSITVNGRIIARNWTTFAPGLKEGSYLAYSLDGGMLEYDAPEGWHDGVNLKAVVLTEEGEGHSIPCSLKNGRIYIDMPADKPVRITRMEDNCEN